MLIDAHAHVDRFEMVGEGAVDAALKEISEHKIFTISNSMDVPSYRKNLSFSEKSAWILPLFGIHPWNASEYVDRLDALDAFILQSAMIGEIGLDFYFVEEKSKYHHQQTVFEYFLSAAEDQNKIVHVHTKGAEETVHTMLGRYSLPGVLIHWYSGSMQTLKKFVDLGAYFTIGIEIKYSDKVKRIAEYIPLNRILTETDNPGGPKMYLGGPGKPSLLLEVIKSLAAARGIGEKEIIQIVQSNLIEFIGEDPLLEPTKTLLEQSGS